jgi:mandelamide amidase
LTAGEVVRRIKDGSLRAEHYAGALLKNFRDNRSLHAVTWINEARVLESARTVDRARARGKPLGPLAGLPLIVKDNIDTVGFPTSAGNTALKKYFPKNNAPVIDTLFGNGAILLAKANMHELARGGTSTNPTFGFVRNPYDPARIPGGSSGGTAAAVAARFAPAGLGTDTAGSVRIPSAFCGVAGLRPSMAGARKRYSNDGVVPMSFDLDTIGPIARTVSDVALLNAVITGRPMPSPAALGGLRVGVPRSDFWEDVDPEVTKVMDQALARLRLAGVTFVDLDFKQFHQLALQEYAALGRAGSGDLAAFLARNAPEITFDDLIAQTLTKTTKAGLLRLREAKVDTAQAEEARTTARRNVLQQYTAFFEANGLAAIAFPTEPVPAPLIRVNGDEAGDVLEINGRQFPESGVLVRNTTMAPGLGTPGLTIPAGLTSQGLPVGLELDGLVDEDDKLLGLGMAVEVVLGRLPAPPRTRKRT